MLIFGPVNITPYSDSELHQMNMDYMVPRESRQEFSDFFQRVPQYSLAGFLIKLTFINYCINGEMLDPQKLLPKTHIEGTSSEKWYEIKHNSLHNNSHEIETVILDIIRSGKRVHLPFFAALIKASVMAKLFPFLRGLPVITTIFLLIIISPFLRGIDIPRC